MWWYHLHKYAPKDQTFQSLQTSIDNRTSIGRELRFAWGLVNCSRWMDLRPRNSSCPAWSLFLVLTVSRCQWTVGVACQQWQRLSDSRPPSMSSPIRVGTCELSSSLYLIMVTTVTPCMRKQESCLEEEIMQGTVPGAHRRGRPRTAWMDNINTWTGIPVKESVRMTRQR